MPVNNCSENGRPGYKWGDAGKCYLYDPSDETSKKSAKKKALNQGLAIGDIAGDAIDKSLTRWFKEKWVDISRPKPGGGFEPCGRPQAGDEKYPKCVPAARAARMTQEEIDSAVRRKRRAESTETREDKKPINVSTVNKSTVNIPTNPKLYAQVKAEAKRKFDVYPSVYANAWLVREYKKRGGGYRTTSKSEDIDFTKEEEMIDGYPAATQSVEINIRNRQNAIDIANYGPINPLISNDEYWRRKAEVFNSSVEDAKSARCENCAAFVQTKNIIDAIAHGLGGEPMAYEIAKVANLGYCDIFEFKCAGKRTCDAWIAGGPVKNI